MMPVTRYLFICPQDSPSGLREGISRQMKELDYGIEYDFYSAESQEDALRHVSLYCDLHKDLDTCFVSCGGDALTSGIAGGLMGAGAGKSLAVFDPGGADSLAACSDGADFGSIASLLAGTVKPIDMIRVNNSYAVNACTFGLEELRSAGGLFGSLSAALRRSFHSVKVSADGVALDTGAISVFAAANGRYAPGRTFCSPLSAIDDGKLDLCILRNLSPARLQKAIQMLASGSYADDPAFAGDFILRRDGSIEIESSKEMTLYADTMPVTDKHFIIKNIPKSVGLVVPGTPG